MISRAQLQLGGPFTISSYMRWVCDLSVVSYPTRLDSSKYFSFILFLLKLCAYNRTSLWTLLIYIMALWPCLYIYHSIVLGVCFWNAQPHRKFALSAIACLSLCYMDYHNFCSSLCCFFFRVSVVACCVLLLYPVLLWRRESVCYCSIKNTVASLKNKKRKTQQLMQR